MRKVMFVALAAILFLNACESATPQSSPTVDTQKTAEALVVTMVVKTIQAMPTSTPLPPTETPLPPTATATQTIQPTDTPVASSETAEPTLKVTV